jgi:hypothetical protein
MAEFVTEPYLGSVIYSSASKNFLKAACKY